MGCSTGRLDKRYEMLIVYVFLGVVVFSAICTGIMYLILEWLLKEEEE